MINYMRLNDGTTLKIEDGASIGNIIYDALSEIDGLEVANKITLDNVSSVKFFSLADDATQEDADDYDGDFSGEYEDLTIFHTYFDVQNLKVLISLREKTDIEKRLDAIEEEQEMQNEAIDYLAMEG